MNELEKTAEQSELSGSQENVNADVPQNTSSEDNDKDFSGGSVNEAKEQKASEKPWKTEENARNAQRRREQREKEIREKAIIEAIGGRNPFTGEEVKDSADIEEYLLMRKIEESGGDPVTDYAKHFKAQAKEVAAVREKEAAEREWYSKDRENFKARFPDVDIHTLVADENFSLFAQGKVGEMPLADIYEGFVKMKGEYDKQAQNMAAQYYANSRSSPGALSSPDTAASDFISREDAQKMSREEIKKNYDKIRASMSKW